MKFFGFDLSRRDKLVEEARGATIENPSVKVSADNFLQFFGVGLDTPGVPVTLEQGLSVPAFSCAVTFLARCMANLPLHAYRDGGDAGPERLKGSLQRVLNEAPNGEWSSYKFRFYFWTQVFTAGRGVAYVEKSGSNIIGIWPMNAFATTVSRVNGRTVYSTEGRTYQASEIIDVPWLLKPDGVGVFSPLALLGDTLREAINQRAYSSGFFKGGGVPPLALTGPMPDGPAAVKRAKQQIATAIESANAKGEQVFPIPAGYELKPVGVDPEKGQMVDARLFGLQEIARGLLIPPVFLQDLTNGTYSNTEQQDLHLSKHVVAPHSKSFEDELNLKLFGAMNNRRYVEHSLDGLLRGDFLARIEAMAKAIQNALLTPDEARALDNRGKIAGGDRAYIQGATVPLTDAGKAKPTGANPAAPWASDNTDKADGAAPADGAGDDA